MRWWHVEELLPIEDELFGAERWTAGMFWSELAQPDSRWYRVALLAGQDGGPRVVGYAGLWESGDRPGAPEVWVQNLAVSRALQRRGLGARLLDELLAEAARRGAHRVALEVRADNEPAQRLYAGRGFEAVGLRRGYYQPSGIDAVVMVREDAR